MQGSPASPVWVVQTHPGGAKGVFSAQDPPQPSLDSPAVPNCAWEQPWAAPDTGRGTGMLEEVPKSEPRERAARGTFLSAGVRTEQADDSGETRNHTFIIPHGKSLKWLHGGLTIQSRTLDKEHRHPITRKAELTAPLRLRPDAIAARPCSHRLRTELLPMTSTGADPPLPPPPSLPVSPHPQWQVLQVKKMGYILNIRALPSSRAGILHK